MQFFPLPSARKSQEIVIKEIESAFKSGKKYVILEGPVGSGKSAVAMTFARSVGSQGAHLITPRKGLQDQYYDDFGDYISLMKGRNAYPCVVDSTPAKHKSVIKQVKAGKVTPPLHGESCATGPCKEDISISKVCAGAGGCPYTIAMEVAQASEIVVHNLHSFMFQTYFAGKFEKRKMMIIDEAHEIEGVVRDFAISSFVLPRGIPDSLRADLTQSSDKQRDWSQFLLMPDNIPEVTPLERQKKEADKEFQTEQDKYLSKVSYLTSDTGPYSRGLSVEIEPVYVPGKAPTAAVKVSFVPHSVASQVKNMLLEYGEQVLLMSGTIYSKASFCAELGIPEAEAYFIRVASSFPVKYRPVYAKSEYQVDTSHARWQESFPEMIAIIRKILGVFKEEKGLIHAPSYASVTEIVDALKDPRLIPHESATAQQTLESFFAESGNRVLVSPICQQGVDFKDDRARFQIITRVPYMNTSSEFVQDMMAKNFAWYNRQALIVFGQQLGRVNRHPSDYGATFLLDSRFNKFIMRNKSLLPQWVHDAIIYK